MKKKKKIGGALIICKRENFIPLSLVAFVGESPCNL